jgi:molybdopterin-guanine dinucleotide biosynthesis protein A
MEVTSIVLAGGKNLRLGRSKALEVIGGKSLIERIVERLAPITNQFLIVTSREQSEFPTSDEIEVLTDIYPERGPLGGIYTGLLASRSSRSIAVACDMPFLNNELLSYMIDLSQDFDAVVPRWQNGMLEPLHAVYAKSCLDTMKTRLENERLSIHRFLNEINVRYIEEEECKRFDPELLSFFNINRPSDLKRATKLVAERGG